MPNDPSAPVEIALRIPGKWSHPGELIERLPEGYRFTPETLVLPDETQIEFSARDADDEFAQVFRSACRSRAEASELATVDSYTVNICLSGPGGSMEAAHTMMQAAAAILKAGGAGVFIDNSAISHGGKNWLEMTEDGGPDALSFAFVTVVGGRTEAYTMGMHVLGLRDVVMKRADAEAEDFGIIDVIRYLAASEKPVEDGHLLCDLDGPRFQAFAHPSTDMPPGSPMHNPFGRLKLVSMKDIAQSN
jgi:hypothetical protein